MKNTTKKIKGIMGFTLINSSSAHRQRCSSACFFPLSEVSLAVRPLNNAEGPCGPSALIIDHRFLLPCFPPLGFPRFSNRRNVKLIPLAVAHIFDLVLNSCGN